MISNKKPADSQKASRGEGLIFAAGDIYGGGAQIIISFFYLIFLTDVVRISPALAGTVILISKIWDAVSDPLMGIITDNTESRWGRRKPYFLAGFFGILVSFFLLWYPAGIKAETGRFIYVLASYMFYSTIQTIVMVPYSAMSSEISTDYKNRTNINGTRLFFSQFSSLLCAVLPLEIVKLFADEKAGYAAMGLSFAVFFAVPFILIFFFTHERVAPPSGKSSLNIRTLVQPFQVRSFRILIVIYLSAFLAMDVVSTVFAYYMNYYLHRSGELNYVLGAMLITQIVMVPVVIYIANKTEKSFVLKISVLIWTAGVVFLSVLNPGWPSWVIYVMAVVIGGGIAGCVVMPWTMYPDVTDAGELAFGKRTSGSFSGVMTFMRKFSSAIGIFIVSQILQVSGYIGPQDVEENGIIRKVIMEQPASVITALKIIVVAIPLFLLFFTFIAASKYPLTSKIHARLNMHLKILRGEPGEDIGAEELKEIKQHLVGKQDKEKKY